MGGGVGHIDLIDHDDRAQTQLQRFFQYKASLWHRAVASIHQKQHTVDHLENALHFTAEIGVAGRVHDVDRDPVIGDGGALGQDRDAALPFERVGIEHGFLGLVGFHFELAGLAQEGVHQRGLAVVYVRDDRDITDVRSSKFTHF